MKTNCLPLLILFLFVLFFSIIGCTDDSDANDPAGNALCYWPLDEIEGTTISDISGNNLTGTAENLVPIWSTDGIKNGCLDFSNCIFNSHVRVNSSDVLNFTTEAFSVAFWMNAPIPDSTINTYIIFKGTHWKIEGDPVKNGCWFGFEIKKAYFTNSLRFCVDDNVIKSQLEVDFDEFVTNDWVHVVGVRNTELKKIILYKNGLWYSELHDSTGSVYCDTNLIIGNCDGMNSPFNGKLDEVFLFNFALNSEQVLNLYTGIIP